MKTNISLKRAGQQGSGLLLTLIMTTIALATLAGALAWSVSSTRLNERSNQYTRSVAAAEANTEAVVAQIRRDFKNGGAKLVNDNRNAYRQIVLTGTNSSTWSKWEFNDASGKAGQTFVDIGTFTNYVDLDSAYTGLKGFVCPVSVISNARLLNSIQYVVAGVRQNIQLANIPIFQFAMYSSGNMEISCGKPLRITGRVHSNGHLYVEPDSDLIFESDVTAVGDILFARHPLDTRVPPFGTVSYGGRKEAHVPSLTLPIGTNASPVAIREIIQPPPAGEDPNSLMGRQRYFNLVDLIITVDDSGFSATTGVPDGRSKKISHGHLKKFASTDASFRDAREEKTVRPLDIDIAALRSWNSTNRSLFGGRNVASIYVLDQRTLLSSELAAVRVSNGLQLPSSGLTVATARPLYVWGHYNQKNPAHLGTANTSSTLPASLVADAITILSSNWTDVASKSNLNFRIPVSTTVNAALLTGTVDTVQDYYGGGMENFPRFLEKWSEFIPVTYNGSMVKMFPSRYATNRWGKLDVYGVPARNWAYDLNFNDGTKLPPLTPSLQKVIRGQWATVAPNRTSS